MVPSIRVQDHPQDSGCALRDSPVLSQHRRPNIHHNRYYRTSAAANSVFSNEGERACVCGARRWVEVDATAADATATGDDPR